MGSRTITYFLTRIGVWGNWIIQLVLDLLIPMLVLGGVSRFASSVSYNFSSRFLQRVPMMMS